MDLKFQDIREVVGFGSFYAVYVHKDKPGYIDIWPII